MITLSLCAIGAIIFTSAFGRALIADVQDKVDINVYFSLSTPESDILNLQKEVDSLSEVKETTYVSRDKALEAFKTKWADNTLIMQGLEEIGDNPFPASLNIKAKDPGQYGSISTFLQNKNPLDSSKVPIISKINYQENKLIIDRLGRIIPAIEKSGSVVAIVLILIAIISVWNTIRLIIFTAKDEISVMKLVGASNIYVRGPLVVSGVMYGIIAAIITLVLMAGIAYWSDMAILRFAGVQVASDFSLIVNVFSTYFAQNFVQILLIIIGAGVILGGGASYIAARRYLKV
jgi:cell division transport system permease protein